MNYVDDSLRISEQYALLTRSQEFIDMLRPMLGHGTPIGSITPASIIARYIDLDTNDLWWATGETNSDWDNIAGDGGGGGSITSITSNDESITVTEPDGPTTDLSSRQTLAFVIATGGNWPAAANELTIITDAGENVELPATPPNGTINTIVNATGINNAAGAIDVLGNGASIWGWTSAGVSNDDSVIGVGVGETVKLRYVAEVNTWDRIDGTYVQDTGLIVASAMNVTQNYVIAKCAAMPLYFTPNQGQFFSQASPYGECWKALQGVDASDLIEVVLSQTLNPLLWDSVDAGGEITVWDRNATNLISCTFSTFGMTSATATAASSLAEVQTIGDDLSVVDGTAIQSASGGSYNVQVKLTPGWD